MWDENRPLKLIKALSFDAFSMQHIIDTDKYFAGEINGADMCGIYAPFCKCCSKWVENPCITAYKIYERMNTVCPMLEATGLEDARVVQAVTDVDKYLASEGIGIDLCGRYAPFCAVCDKNQPFPCGQAYLRLRAVEGFSTKALAAQVGGELVINMPRWDDALTQALDEAVVVESEQADTQKEEQPVAAAAAPEAEITVEEAPPRRAFRIGTARRRIPREESEESAGAAEEKAE